MHPYDTRRTIEWAVHLVARIILVGWAVGLLATAFAFLTGESAIQVFVFVWPLAVGLWLLFVSAPEPLLVDDEDKDADRH